MNESEQRHGKEFRIFYPSLLGQRETDSIVIEVVDGVVLPEEDVT